MRFRVVLPVLILALAAPVSAADAGDGLYDPIAIFLTWQQDPLTTMTIDWHTEGEDRPVVVHYRKAGEGPWRALGGDTREFPFSERLIHRVELTGLEPATKYEFRFGANSKIYNFETMPENIVEPLRIAIGGDVRHEKEWMDRTNRVAMEYDPHFIVWLGDLAYADEDPRLNYRWYEFFDSIKETLITEDGQVIPIVVMLGNHEVVWLPRLERNDGLHYAEEHGWENHDAIWFYELFAFPKEPGYGTLDFGDYLSLIILNTDHGEPIEGRQAEWLEEQLAARQDIPHVFPMFHVPTFPSVRDWDTWGSVDVREHWMPIFDEYGVKFVYEAHDHAYKRTEPIRDLRVNDRGTVYIGDGAWGVGERDIHDPGETWYLREAKSVRHFILATLQGKHIHHLMVDEHGNHIDEYPEGIVRMQSAE